MAKETQTQIIFFFMGFFFETEKTPLDFYGFDF